MEAPQVQIDTSMGSFTVELYYKHAPRTVKNFVELSKRGYYDGTKVRTPVHLFVSGRRSRTHPMWVLLLKDTHCDSSGVGGDHRCCIVTAVWEPIGLLGTSLVDSMKLSCCQVMAAAAAAGRFHVWQLHSPSRRQDQ
jgi:hypothetical protein